MGKFQKVFTEKTERSTGKKTFASQRREPETWGCNCIAAKQNFCKEPRDFGQNAVATERQNSQVAVKRKAHIQWRRFQRLSGTVFLEILDPADHCDGGEGQSGLVATLPSGGTGITILGNCRETKPLVNRNRYSDMVL